MNHIETIIASGTLAGSGVYESLSNFPASSLKIRPFVKGRCIPLSLFVSTSNIGTNGVRLSINSQILQSERYGLEYASEFETQILDIYADSGIEFKADEEISISIQSSAADFWNVYLTVYYEDIEPLFKNRFISGSELFSMPHKKVVKTSPLITMTGSGNPVWKTLSSFLQAIRPQSTYAITGGTCRHYQGAGFSPSVYPLILTGKFSGGGFFALPMNCINNPPSLTQDYTLTLSQRFENIRSIPVIKGWELTETFFEMYGDAAGADQFIASLHLYELPVYHED